MTYVLMVLICAGQGEWDDCRYVNYHGMQYDSMAKCVIAMDFVQRVKKPDVAPEMICQPSRKT